RSIQAEYDSETLQQKILQTIFELTPAEHAALILLDDRTKDIESVRSYDRKMQSLDQAISMSVIELVLRDQTALLSNDISQSSKELASKSLAHFDVTSLIAVPMIWMGRVRGIVYLDTGDRAVKFDEDHLQLASAIAAIGAASLKGLRYISSLQSDHS